MKRISTIIATVAALSIILVIACTEAKVPTTGSEISASFSALAQLFSAEQPDLEAQASTADKFARTPEALAIANNKAINGEEHERAAAAAVLARIDNPKAVEQLCLMIEDDSKLARENVYIALQRQNTPAARIGLTRAMELNGLEDGLTEVICEVMDAEMWAATSEMIILSTDGASEIEFDFDFESIKDLIASAKEHDFETAHFDEAAFAEKMKQFGEMMKEKFGHGEDDDITIKVKAGEGDAEVSIS